MEVVASGLDQKTEVNRDGYVIWHDGTDFVAKVAEALKRQLIQDKEEVALHFGASVPAGAIALMGRKMGRQGYFCSSNNPRSFKRRCRDVKALDTADTTIVVNLHQQQRKLPYIGRSSIETRIAADIKRHLKR